MSEEVETRYFVHVPADSSQSLCVIVNTGLVPCSSLT